MPGFGCCRRKRGRYGIGRRCICTSAPPICRRASRCWTLTTLPPGGEATAQIVTDRPLGALHGDRFILRDQSAQRTIGGGRLLDPWPPARGRRRPERLAALRALDKAAPAAALTELISGDPGWVELQRFAQMWNLTDEEASACWTAAGLKVAAGPDRPFGFSVRRCSSLCGAVVATLRRPSHEDP